MNSRTFEASLHHMIRSKKVCLICKATLFLAMHYSAKRGLAIACPPSVRLSVCLSVTLVDQEHIGWKYWKLIARTISPTPSLFVAQRKFKKNIQLFPEECGEICRRLEVGLGKMVCWCAKAAISLKRVKMEKKLQWRAYRNSLTLFRTVLPPTPYGILFPKIGVPNLTQNSNLKFLANECMLIEE